MSFMRSYRTLKEYRRDPLGFFQKLFRENGHFSQLEIFGKKLFIVSDPEDVMHVLKGNHAAYSKGRTTKALQKFLGRGLITNDDPESWRKQHRLIRPIMNPRSVFEFAPRIHEVVEEFLPEMDRTPTVNAFHEMNRLTWRIVLRTLFSQKVTPEMDAWLDDVLELMEIITNKTRSALPLPSWVPTHDNRALKRSVAKFDDYVYGMIRSRRGGERKHDLIQLLIDASDEGIANMSDLEIRDEVMTFLMAGHETITNSLSWLFVELARHPEVRPQLEPEAKAFIDSKNYEALHAAPWLSAAIDESMRLWPPVWVFMRQAEKEDTIRGVKIPVGANVVLGTILSHRAPDLWDEPEQFDPSRFIGRKHNPGAYYPFGQGPRACIGATFAGVEAKIILALMVHHYTWEIIGPAPQESRAGITLRPTNNVIMKFRRR